MADIAIDLTKLITAEDKAASAKETLIAGVNRERDRRCKLGAPIDLGDGRAFTADIDERSVINITALALDATRAQAAGSTDTIPFRDHANVTQTLSPADVIAMAEQAMARVTAIYEASWTLKDADPIPADYAADGHWPAN